MPSIFEGRAVPQLPVFIRVLCPTIFHTSPRPLPCVYCSLLDGTRCAALEHYKQTEPSELPTT